MSKYKLEDMVRVMYADKSADSSIIVGKCYPVIEVSMSCVKLGTNNANAVATWMHDSEVEYASLGQITNQKLTTDQTQIRIVKPTGCMEDNLLLSFTLEPFHYTTAVNGDVIIDVTNMLNTTYQSLLADLKKSYTIDTGDFDPKHTKPWEEKISLYKEVLALKEKHQFITNAEIGRQVGLTGQRIGAILKRYG
jgi:hypothetical protein